MRHRFQWHRRIIILRLPEQVRRIGYYQTMKKQGSKPFSCLGLELVNLQDWFVPGIVVRILDTVGDRGLSNQIGVIRGIKVCTTLPRTP